MKKFWIIPTVSLVLLTWIWYANPFAPKETHNVVLDSTESVEIDSTVMPGDTIIVYKEVEVPVYVQHVQETTVFDWTREIMTFIIGAGNILLLIRRKNAANNNTPN